MYVTSSSFNSVYCFIFLSFSHKQLLHGLDNSLQLGHLLLTSHQVRVRRTHGTSDSVKGQSVRLGRELNLGSNVEEGKVPRDQVVGYPSGLVLFSRISICNIAGGGKT